MYSIFLLVLRASKDEEMRRCDGGITGMAGMAKLAADAAEAEAAKSAQDESKSVAKAKSAGVVAIQVRSFDMRSTWPPCTAWP